MGPAHELRLYGHRGASAILPENTVAAFHKALADGATALELDVQRTADGHFVVIHDDDGWRTARRAENVCEVPLVMVKSWDAGAGFEEPDGSCPHAGRGHRVPTLGEVLEEFPDAPVVVDIKPEDVAIVPALLELIADRGAEDRVTLAADYDRVTLAIRRLGYRGRTALTRREIGTLRFLPLPATNRHIGGQVARVPLRAGPFRLDTDTFLARCRGLGLRADYWVVNEPGTAWHLLARGATGIMTDDPALLLPVFRSFERGGEPTKDHSDECST
jgi:glycerophosphoryl diester phosphodiesterase